MELGPIPGVRGLPAVRTRPSDFRPPAIFEIDAAAKPGDGGSQQNGRKAAGAEEDADELRIESQADVEASAEAPEDSHTGRIDTFA
jgi:hypothetical protein